MKKVNFILGTIVLLLVATSCTDDLVNNYTTTGIIETGSNLAIPTTTKLVGTKWKLVGFFDVEKNTLREAEDPYNRSYVYTLNFDTDSTFTGHLHSNEIALGNYVIYNDEFEINKLYKIDIVRILTTKIVEYFDGELFEEALYKAQSFTLANNSLKLYYNDGKNYLLFKKR